jgi:hypothetical protein
MRVWPILNSALHSHGIDEDHPALVTSKANTLWLNAFARQPVQGKIYAKVRFLA